MKRLFSPWRSVYIQSFQDTKKPKGCLFCRIAKEKNDEKNLIVWRGKLCFAVMNRYPYNNGHMMIVPYKHTSSLENLTNEINLEVMQTVSRCINALGKISKPDGFNFGSNIGKEAGAGIAKHIHFHIVPRWNGDTNFFPVLADVKIVSERIEKNWKELESILNNSRPENKK